ncbi:hypothetical protein [Rhizobium sp. AP16]|uniref:terminase small subunit-like protein n=1 Tax=Rhizobium sp. AP16 TaxID=1144306 RepID=UPI00026ED254|nr:hypothetical protein [Rhizobium sp. AP16]EJK83545.1 hypothetical protein PMI03_03200 [Rhizobium sp. AP16]
MTGRPTKFTIKTSDIICDRIANGESLRSICLDEALPAKSTVFAWLTQHEAFRTKYALAREAQADVLVDEMIDIADDGSNDWMEKKNADGELIGWQENGEALRRSQLRISTRQWIAEKMRPKKYGAKVEVEHGVTNGVADLLEALNGKTRGLPNST